MMLSMYTYVRQGRELCENCSVGSKSIFYIMDNFSSPFEQYINLAVVFYLNCFPQVIVCPFIAYITVHYDYSV